MLPRFSERYRSAHLSADLPCNVDHGIIGLMDPAHGPFVHQAWWWRSRASIHEKHKTFEPIPQGFRMSAHAPSGNSAPYKLLGVYGEPITTTIDFVLPNRRWETIRCGKKWFSSLTTVTPVTASTCRIDVVAAWNVFYHVPLVTTIARFFGARFVRQDQQTMIEQAQGLRHNPTLMLIDDADRPAKWYFALKQARLERGRQPSDGWPRHACTGEVRPVRIVTCSSCAFPWKVRFRSLAVVVGMSIRRLRQLSFFAASAGCCTFLSAAKASRLCCSIYVSVWRTNG